MDMMPIFDYYFLKEAIMKRQKIVTLILLLLLLTSTIQFQQKIVNYASKVVFLTENPATAIVCFANALIHKEHWRGNVGVSIR
jgi:hypothetical protein